MRGSLTSVELALQVRISVLEMSLEAQSSHIGSALSVVDILSVLYSEIIDVDKIQRLALDRDYVVFSKGHATAALYATLAHAGLLNLGELQHYGHNGTILMQHASHKVPGVEFSTGSLGHGLSIGCGVAEGKRMMHLGGKTFVIASDGDLNAGSTWEGILYAATRGLDIVLVVDANGLQSLGPAREVLDLEPLDEKLRAFGWDTQVVDGHDHGALRDCLLGSGEINGPLAIVARTTKGKGVPYMEDQVLWHYKSLDRALFNSAREALEQA